MKTKTTRNKLTKRVFTLALALALALALLPALPVAQLANAAEANPWTGRWSERDPLTGNPGEDLCFWQSGDRVVGTHGSYGSGRFEGTASGNTLTGTITNNYGTYDGAEFTMSADGSITGTYQYQAYGKANNLQLTKRLDYSEVAPEYSPGTAISWTGLWRAGGYSYGSIYIVQDGDSITGFIGYNGYIEGTVSGDTLTAHYIAGQKVGSNSTLVFTMSADGGSLSVYSYFGNSTSNTEAGTRLSPITYVPAAVTPTPAPETPAPATPAPETPQGLAANPTPSTVYVDGVSKGFEAYNIDGSNYFKLRDLANVLSGTKKQFEVGYDEDTKAVTLTSGEPYTPNGSEMAKGDGTAKTASPTASRIYLDGKELNLTVYIIGGNNFFKLRDLMEVIDVFVDYDEATKAITLDTGKGYGATPEATTPPSAPPDEAPSTPPAAGAKASGTDSRTTISTGPIHNLFVKNDGSLWGFGTNLGGALGSSFDPFEEIKPVKIMDGVVAAHAGHASSYVIKTDGTLWAWGGNANGTLGDGTTTDKTEPVKIMDGVTEIYTYAGQCYAIKSDGSLWSWGDNGNGALGDGTQTDRHSPVKIMDGVASVGAGANCGFAVKNDGSLWGWGLIPKLTIDGVTHQNALTPVKLMDGVAAVSAGTFHVMALKTDGTLWCWGVINLDGQIGNGTTEPLGPSVPVKVMDGVTAIAARMESSFALKTDGTLWAWGANQKGMLGDGTETKKISPVKVMDGVAVIGAGLYRTMALKGDGTLWGCGASEVGDGSSKSRVNFVKITDGVKLP